MTKPTTPPESTDNQMWLWTGAFIGILGFGLLLLFARDVFGAQTEWFESGPVFGSISPGELALQSIAASAAIATLFAIFANARTAHQSAKTAANTFELAKRQEASKMYYEALRLLGSKSNTEKTAAFSLLQTLNENPNINFSVPTLNAINSFFADSHGDEIKNVYEAVSEFREYDQALPESNLASTEAIGYLFAVSSKTGIAELRRTLKDNYVPFQNIYLSRSEFTPQNPENLVLRRAVIRDVKFTGNIFTNVNIQAVGAGFLRFEGCTFTNCKFDFHSLRVARSAVPHGRLKMIFENCNGTNTSINGEPNFFENRPYGTNIEAYAPTIEIKGPTLPGGVAFSQ